MNMNKLGLEKINKGVELYEKLKKLPLTKRERELFFSGLDLLDCNVENVEEIEITKEYPDYRKCNRVYRHKEEGSWRKFLLITEESDFLLTSEELRRKVDTNPFSQRYIIVYWENEKCKIYVHEKEEMTYSSYQRNMARILGIEL